jgi:hypothetical protein
MPWSDGKFTKYGRKEVIAMKAILNPLSKNP